MTTDTTAVATTQVYRVWIRATPEKIWAAITDPEFNSKYAYRAPGFFDLKKGGSYHATATAEMKEFAAANGFEVPDTIIDGEVLESEPPRRLVQTWRMLMDPGTAAEPYTTLTWEIEEAKMQAGVCKLTVTHQLTDAPATARMTAGTEDEGAGGGWAWILCDLKTYLETGSAFAG
ncbi:SRPBCC domain-containing protein [Paractinoplanes rishiriensis]|uniref:Transcriptional regulator n=1 Tax=Paractinoplanes rishiriensis TaxID=1050105 RepID=A0A919K3U3_9ACTN|nr:SRPBCC domain-containing protein [Actinoplanes rishiriensis]GIF00397.1 transcriptional regulator [Actinoplanes rishiriensis]